MARRKPDILPPAACIASCAVIAAERLGIDRRRFLARERRRGGRAVSRRVRLDGPAVGEATAQVRRAEERDARARAVRVTRRWTCRRRGAKAAGEHFPSYFVSQQVPVWDDATRGAWRLEVGGMVAQAAQALARGSRGAAAHRLQARSLLRRGLDGGRDAHGRAPVRPRAARRRAAAGASTSTSSRSTTATTRAGTSRARCIRRRSSCTRRTGTI